MFLGGGEVCQRAGTGTARLVSVSQPKSLDAETGCLPLSSNPLPFGLVLDGSHYSPLPSAIRRASGFTFQRFVGLPGLGFPGSTAAGRTQPSSTSSPKADSMASAEVTFRPSPIQSLCRFSLPYIQFRFVPSLIVSI